MPPNAEYRSVNAPWTYFFSPGRPGARRRLVEPGHGRRGDQGPDQRHRLAGQARGLRQARVDEPLGHGGAGHVGDQLPAPLHRDVLENHQVHRQRPEPGADRQRGVRHARRARRGVRLPAGAFRAVQVVLHPLRRRSRDLLLLKRAGQPPHQRRPPGPRRTSTRPRDRRPRSGPGPPHVMEAPGLPGCFPRFFFFFSARSAARRCFLGRLPPRQVIRARRHRGVPAVPRPRSFRRRELLPQVSDHRLQHGDPLRLPGDLPCLDLEPRGLLPDQRITQYTGQPLRRRIGHSRQSSPKPRPATTATPSPQPSRNQRSRTATPSPDA